MVMIGFGTLLAQVLLPLLAADTGRWFPEVQHLVVPYSIAAVLMVVGVQVALVGVWMLVTAFADGTLLDRRRVAHVDAIRLGVAVAAAIPAGTAIHLLFFERLGGPGIVLALAFVCVVGPSLWIFLSLLRTVYLRASDEHAELEAVI